MMRFHQTGTAALAALFVLPAAAQLGLGQTLDLEGRLAATVNAIEGLLGVEQRAAAGDADALRDVLAATEAPILDGPGRDRLLGELRREVGALHEVLDGMSLSEVAVGTAHAGLTDAEREALRGMREGEPQPAGPARDDPTRNDPDESPGSAARTDFEKNPAYTADAVRQARLLVRAGRELEAIELLAPFAERADAEHAEARYWLARAHDRSGQVDAALALYEALAADEAAGKYRERAELDRGFLLVKRRLLEERAAAGETRGGDE